MEVAEAIAQGLESAGYTTWYYERDSLPGMRYLLQVAQAIASSEALLLVISPHSLDSDQVTNEIDVAYESGKRLVPVLHRITHVEWRSRRADWRQALGAATTISIPAAGSEGIVARVAQGLAAMHILPVSGVAPTSRTTRRKPKPHAPVPHRKRAEAGVQPDPATTEQRPRGSGATDVVAPPTETIRINLVDGAEMIWVPSGTFLMGDDDMPNNPRRTVTLSGCWIYTNLVTVGMYKEYCRATGTRMPSRPSFNAHWIKEDHPIVNVSWQNAKAYCKWAEVDLPTEAQWERAARGTDGRKYPWGNEFDPSKVWASKAELGDAGGTTAVGHYGVSPCGCADIVGNAWQWCADWYDEEYTKTAPANDPEGPTSGTYRVIRGGSWSYLTPGYFRCALRGGSRPANRNDNFGFRCTRSQAVKS